MPEKLASLIKHLKFTEGEKYLFVDPDNKLYDALDLNRGAQRTFFNVNTPYAFLERFTAPNGLNDLSEVMSKWNKGMSIFTSFAEVLLKMTRSDDNPSAC
jgi:hypothetical protein